MPKKNGHPKIKSQTLGDDEREGCRFHVHPMAGGENRRSPFDFSGQALHFTSLPRHAGADGMTIHILVGCLSFLLFEGP